MHLKIKPEHMACNYDCQDIYQQPVSITAGNALPVVEAEIRGTSFCLGPSIAGQEVATF